MGVGTVATPTARYRRTRDLCCIAEESLITEHQTALEVSGDKSGYHAGGHTLNLWEAPLSVRYRITKRS
jgi:hypothetical protein